MDLARRALHLPSWTTTVAHIGRMFEDYRVTIFQPAVAAGAADVIFVESVVWEEYWPDPDDVELTEG